MDLGFKVWRAIFWYLDPLGCISLQSLAVKGFARSNAYEGRVYGIEAVWLSQFWARRRAAMKVLILHLAPSRQLLMLFLSWRVAPPCDNEALCVCCQSRRHLQRVAFEPHLKRIPSLRQYLLESDSFLRVLEGNSRFNTVHTPTPQTISPTHFNPWLPKP